MRIITLELYSIIDKTAYSRFFHIKHFQKYHSFSSICIMQILTPVLYSLCVFSVLINRYNDNVYRVYRNAYTYTEIMITGLPV